MEGPEGEMGGDISTTWAREGWLYLDVVIDLFARLIVGLSVVDRRRQGLALAIFRKALMMRRPAPGLFHHAARRV